MVRDVETLSLCPSVSLLVVGSLSLTLDSLCVDREVSLSVSEVDRDVSLSVSQTEFDVKGKDKRCHCLTDGFPLSLPVWTPVMDPSQDPWSCRDGRSPSLSLSLPEWPPWPPGPALVAVVSPSALRKTNFTIRHNNRHANSRDTIQATDKWRGQF